MVAQTSAKNSVLTGSASMDLGLGAITQQDLADQEEERKKKLLQAQSSGLNAMGPATQALYTPAAGSVLS